MVRRGRQATERGATFTEYIVLIALIVAIVVAVLEPLQGALNNVIGTVANAIAAY